MTNCKNPPTPKWTIKGITYTIDPAKALGFRHYPSKDTGDYGYLSMESPWMELIGEERTQYFYSQPPTKTIGGSLRKAWGVLVGKVRKTISRVGEGDFLQSGHD